jgi:hypothetical protein
MVRTQPRASEDRSRVRRLRRSSTALPKRCHVRRPYDRAGRAPAGPAAAARVVLSPRGWDSGAGRVDFGDGLRSSRPCLLLATRRRDRGYRDRSRLCCGRWGPREHLRDRQGDELRVGDLRGTARTLPRRQEIVNTHVSAMTRASRSACTRPPWSTLRCATPPSAPSLCPPARTPRAAIRTQPSSVRRFSASWGGLRPYVRVKCGRITASPVDARFVLVPVRP